MIVLSTENSWKQYVFGQKKKKLVPYNTFLSTDTTNLSFDTPNLGGPECRWVYINVVYFSISNCNSEKC